ncbi:MAG TPA: GDP-mannose 4,6-dehydratase [Actinomycetota bacterium]|nr:GDP-mannose 4,6-dehydratase [Actinomycetota bacterium]
MRVLITGVTGFVGSHLAEYCLGLGHEVAGTMRWRSQQENLAEVRDRVTLFEADLRDGTAARHVIGTFSPERIFHLAAQSFVAASWSAPAETLTTNVQCQVHLLEAVREANLDARIQVAGSSEEYGKVSEDELPIRETNALRPMSPYAVSKVAQDLMGFQYHQSYGTWIVRTRAFNHEGPRRGEVFVTSSFAKQIALAEAGRGEPVLNVGNLEAQRDFTDVRDVVKAYWLALEKCEPGEVYNIGSGRAWKISDVAEMLIGMAKVPIEIRQDPSRMRPSDVLVLQADTTRFRETTGWEPTIPFEQTLWDTLEYWRDRVRERA